MTPLRTRNDELLTRLTPYLVALPAHAALLERAPFGLPIADENVVDPTRMASEPFLALLQELDRLTFGPEGMPMPRWVFYDGSELPGAVFGFGLRARDLGQEELAQLHAPPGYDGLVPLSMYIAIPVRPPSVWFGHNLASLNRVFPSLRLAGLASFTKAFALRVFRCEVQIGATQWDSDALHIHAAFGPLDLVTAWTPAHSEPWTLTYRFAVTEDKLRAALGDPDVELAWPAAELFVARADEEAQRELQRRLERGESFCVAGRPRGSGSTMRVPVARR